MKPKQDYAKNMMKQAGAELCQAQFKLGLAETALAIEKYWGHLLFTQNT